MTTATMNTDALRRLKMTASTTTNIQTNIHATDKYRRVAEQLPEEALLGQLLWFSITSADVNLEKAQQELVNLGLPEDALPKVLRPADVFRRAAREMGHRFKPVDDTRSEVLVRAVGEDDDKAYRHLMLERADYRTGKARRVYYEKVGEIVFTRGTKNKYGYSGFGVEVIDTTADLTGDLLPEERAWLDAAMEGFEARFQHLMSHMDSHAVRAFVRKEIARLDGVCVKESGGVYFVRQSGAEDLKKLQVWVNRIGSQFHTVPLLDLADQRQMIAQAFEEETVAEVQRLMDEIAGILQAGTAIEERTFDQYGTRAAELTRRINEYAEMLGDRSELAALQVQLFTGQLVSLSDQVRQPGQRRGRVA